MIRIARCFAAFAVALSFTSATARAAEGDVQLFNGKDLTGWQVHYKEPGPKIEDVWSVKEGGILHCKGKPIGYIYTDKDHAAAGEGDLAAQHRVPAAEQERRRHLEHRQVPHGGRPGPYEGPAHGEDQRDERKAGGKR
jgi:hypothetical protein